MNKFIIVAKRSNNETVFYVNNPMQGATMLPNAASLAREYITFDEANLSVYNLQLHFKGLKDWRIVLKDWF